MGQKAEKTKALILREAYRLFAAKGFQAVTMADICQQTGLSRGGLYRYYGSTGQIFEEILSHQTSADSQIQRQQPASILLDQLLSTLHQEILDREASLSLAIYEYANLGGRELFSRLHSQAKQRWISLIRYGMDTGQFRQVDPDQISDLILYYYQGLWLWSRVIPLDRQAADHYVQTVRQLLLEQP